MFRVWNAKLNRYMNADNYVIKDGVLLEKCVSSRGEHYLAHTDDDMIVETIDMPLRVETFKAIDF